MADPRIELVERFFFGTGPSYDLVARLWTMGLDVWWKKKILESIPEDSNRIIDQASGTGVLTFKIARKFPNSQVFGVELRHEYLKRAIKKAKILKINNVEFIQGRAEDVFLGRGFDCIVSSYLAKYAELSSLIKNAEKMLRPGGTILIHDFSYPGNRAAALAWRLNFKIMQKIGSRFFPEWRTLFYELPQLIKDSNWDSELLDLLKQQGFSVPIVEKNTFGVSTSLISRKQ